MPFLDVFLLIIILYGTLSGYKSGFINTAGSLLGLFIGVYLASRYYEVVAAAWQWLFFGSATVAKGVVFIVIFLLVSRVVKLAVYLADKFFNLLRFFPFTKFINKLAGGVLGLIEGSLIAGLIVFIIVRYPISSSLAAAVASSDFAQQLLTYVEILSPLIADTLEKAKITLL